MPHVYVVLAATALWVALTWVYARKKKLFSLPLPPSPKADFLIGHLRSMPSLDEHKVFEKWGKELRSKHIAPLRINRF